VTKILESSSSQEERAVSSSSSSSEEEELSPAQQAHRERIKHHKSTGNKGNSFIHLSSYVAPRS
jgi:hypothetical protein